MALLEVCVDSYASARAAYLGGADRFELCGQLSIGGVTPSVALFEQVKREFPVPIRVLIRPRGGDFLYSKEEREQILREIELFTSLGADGVVIGALTASGFLDETALQSFIKGANGLKLTLHRAFDQCRDAFAAMETAISLGFDTILTSGQCASASEGAPLLKELVSRARGRMQIMAGGGVRKENILSLHETCGVELFHASCRKKKESGMNFSREEVKMGQNDSQTLFVADRAEVFACAQAVHSIL